MNGIIGSDWLGRSVVLSLLVGRVRFISDWSLSRSKDHKP